MWFKQLVPPDQTPDPGYWVCNLSNLSRVIRAMPKRKRGWYEWIRCWCDISFSHDGAGGEGVVRFPDWHKCKCTSKSRLGNLTGEGVAVVSQFLHHHCDGAAASGRLTCCCGWTGHQPRSRFWGDSSVADQPPPTQGGENLPLRIKPQGVKISGWIESAAERRLHLASGMPYLLVSAHQTILCQSFNLYKTLPTVWTVLRVSFSHDSVS